MRRVAAPFVLALLAIFGVATALAVGGGETTGTVTACATASTPAQTVAANGSLVGTIPGSTSTRCETATYTVPTVTQTVTADTTTAPTPSPSGSPYWHGDFAAGSYAGYETIFESSQTDSRLSPWGGLPASDYDAKGMSTDPAQRVHLIRDLPGPPGASSAWVSRQEEREGEPWTTCAYSTAACALQKSSIRTSSTSTWNGSFHMGDVRWFSWWFYLPLNRDGDTFRTSLNTFTALGDLHPAGSPAVASWAVNAQCPCSGWWYTSGPYATGRWLYLSVQGGSSYSNNQIVPFLKYQNDDGSANTDAYGHWHQIVLGMKASDQGSPGSSPGWIDFFFDGALVKHVVGPNVAAGETAPYFMLQNYVHAGVDFEGGTSSVIYYADPKIGLSQEDVK